LNLIIAIQQSNHSAFREMYLQWHERAYYYFLKKAKSEEVAKELVQLTFIKLWQYRASLSIEYSFEVQLFTIARSVWIDELRKRAKERTLHQPLDESSQDAAAPNNTTAFETDNVLQAVLDHLPPVRRKVFELNRLQGYSYKEIAQHLGISVKTVDNHLSQAIKQLKTLLVLLSVYVLHLF